MSEAAPIRVFVLDDHELVRRGMAEMIGAHDDLVVVGEAATADEAVRGIRATEPDVAVLDIRLRHGCGLDVCRTITRDLPSVASLIFTAVADERALLEAAEAGARALSMKSIRSSELVDHIRAVAAGADLLERTPARVGRELGSPTPGGRRRSVVAAGAAHRRTHRPGVVESRDRARVDPRREDGQELRVPDPGEAGDVEPNRDRRPGGPPRRTGGPLDRSHEPDAGNGVGTGMRSHRHLAPHGVNGPRRTRLVPCPP